ncbi:hypothetical protein NSK_006203, partial [Nannochloropsis salina CCMP1776]
FFAFLLRRIRASFPSSSPSSPLPSLISLKSLLPPFLRLVFLALTVLLSFAAVWLPFCLSDDQGCLQGVLHGGQFLLDPLLLDALTHFGPFAYPDVRLLDAWHRFRSQDLPQAAARYSVRNRPSDRYIFKSLN